MQPATVVPFEGEPARLPSPIRAVILDYGDVISLPQDPAVIAWMADLFHLPQDRFREIYGRFRHDYDCGTVTPEQYWTNVAHAAGTDLAADQVALLRRQDIVMWGRINSSVVQWAGRLRAAGTKTAVLSNMHCDMIDHLRSNGEWTGSFDCLTLSAALKTAKPQPGIFQHCLNSLAVKPEEALFIDDREANVSAARKLGIHGIVAPTFAELQGKLKAAGFQPLPE